MKAQLLMLSTCALLAAAPAVRAEPNDLRDYAARAYVRAEEQLVAAGVRLDGRTVAVSGRIGSDGRLHALRLVQGSGSLDTDQSVLAALRKLEIPYAPTEAIDGALLLHLMGHADAAEGLHQGGAP